MTAGQIRGFELHPQPDLWQQWKCLHFAKLVILCVCERESGGKGRGRGRRGGERGFAFEKIY